MEKLRLGIIGVGNIGTGHAGNILEGQCPEIEITAAADRRESRRNWIREKLPDIPVFTTAYDEYALKAFEVNSVDYLLKPINAGDLQRALQKLRGWLAGGHGQDGALLQRAMEMMQQHYRHYRRYFLIPVRDKLVPLDVESIACVCVREGSSVALTADGHSYMLDKGLDAVMTQLDPRRFFRVNRQYIVAHRAIKEISVWLPGKYWLRLCVDTGERVVVPRARVNEFKEWYAGEIEN